MRHPTTLPDLDGYPPSRYRDKTNNAAERALRHAVIMRKTQLGTQSEHGNRWIERILSCARRADCNTAPCSPT
jgi:hypothetical protein